MTTLPSKELLSEVLKNELPLNSLGFNICKIEKNTLIYGIEFSFKREINIYELAFRIRNYFFKKGFYLVSGERLQDTSQRHIVKILNFEYEVLIVFTGGTETEAIFKATQYIYDNLSNI